MDKLFLPFTSPPTLGTESQRNIPPPSHSLLKLANGAKSKLAMRRPSLNLFKLSNDKKLRLIDQDQKLPTTVSDLKQDAKAVASEPIPLSAYFLLASAVFSLSFIAPLLDLQEADPIMKIVWRQVATTMLLAVMSISTLIREGSFGINGPPSAKSWGYAILAGILYAPMCISFSMALDYTSVEDAVAFSNSQSLLILAGKFMMGSAVSLRQSIGALTAFGGAIFCNRDSDQMIIAEYSSTSTDGDDSTSIEEIDARVLYGDLLSFASSFFGVGYLLLSKEARSEISLFPFMFAVMLSAAVVSNLIAFVTGEPIQVWSMDEDWGTFGFLHVHRFDRLPLEIITVIVCNIFGTMGYIRALRYFDPFVVSVAALSEPVVAQFLAALAQVGLLPGWRGWIGNALIAIGTYWVAYQPQETKEETQKQEPHEPQEHAPDDYEQFPEKKEEPQQSSMDASDSPPQ